MPRKRFLQAITALAVAIAAFSAAAQIKVGITLSVTGPAASLGIPEKNTVALLPKEIAGKKVEYIVLDDASDSTAASKNARKFTTEDKVDVIVGSTISPNSLAMIEVAAEGETPLISISGASRIVEPMDAKKYWVFKDTQHDTLMAEGIVEHMLKSGAKTMAYIGFNDAYGEGWWQEVSKIAEAKKLPIVASERYNRTDTSVLGQVLKIIAAKPDAVLIVGAGTPAVLPQKTLKEKGYKGPIYQTHGVANSDFLRVGGQDLEGTFVPVGPILVAEQLPETHPVKSTALEYFRKYEKEYGAGSISTFGAHMWDASLMLQAAIPEALKKAQPGTKEFRKALRDALEGLRDLKLSHGVMTVSPTNHNGYDGRARVMVKIEGGKWKLVN